MKKSEQVRRESEELLEKGRQAEEAGEIDLAKDLYERSARKNEQAMWLETTIGN